MESPATFTLRDGVAVVVLDAPGEKVNVLSAPFLQALEECAHTLAATAGITGAVVLSGKDKGFIAGADIGEIEAVSDAGRATELATQGQRILGLWAALPFPVVAAIHGHCLGGGAEFALACHYRLGSEDAVLALPEVRLGIFPGFGGTQRLPRLISLERSLELILGGRTVKAKEALRIGLIDGIVAGREELLEEALALLRDPAPALRARSRAKNGWRRLLLEKNPLGRALLFGKAKRKMAEKTGGHYPAPAAALQVVRRGLRLPLAEGLRLEAEALGPVATGPVCKNLIYLYRLTERAKKGLPSEVPPPPARRAAVLGAGVMGADIARLLVDHGLTVVLKDIDRRAVDAALERIRRGFSRKRGVRAEEVEEKMGRVTGTDDYGDFAGVDLVIEAIVEQLPVKQRVLKQTEEHLSGAALFASNTSALSVTALQSAAARPEKVGGMHFFNPVERMPLVEIIRGEHTSPATAAQLFATALRLGKTPILVADRPGFLVNRLLMVYLYEACQLLAEGCAWRTIDERARAFGFPMGPFRLLDEVGLDIAAEVGAGLVRAFPYLQENRLLERAVAAGLQGKKGGRGFYLHATAKQPSKEPRPNGQIAGILQTPNRRPATEGDWRRLLLVMVNEAGRCLQEGVVVDPRDVDTGLVFGAGFPPFRGGLCRWADGQGLPGLVEEMEELAGRFGERFAPSGYLRDRPSFLP